MDIKKVLITPLILLLWTTSACADSEKEAIEKVRALTEHEQAWFMIKEYEEQGLTQYKNLQDYYLAMKFYGFPNLETHENYAHVKHLDFKNPQSLKEYREIRDTISERFEKANAFKKNQEDKWQPKTKEQWAEEDALLEKKFKRGRRFKKEVFYQFFKKKLAEPNTESVRICFNIDTIRLGLFGMKAATVTLDEENAIIESGVKKLLSTLGFELGSKNNLSIHDWRVSCHALITVNQEELEKLYQSEKVASIINPEIDRPATFNPL